jgi:hypothetical protein
LSLGYLRLPILEILSSFTSSANDSYGLRLGENKSQKDLQANSALAQSPIGSEAIKHKVSTSVNRIGRGKYRERKKVSKQSVATISAGKHNQTR